MYDLFFEQKTTKTALNNSEIELVKQCQRQNPSAQAALYNAYKRRMLGICRRYAHTTFEAEDIFQDAFIKVFKKIHTLEKPEAVGGWIKSLVIRTAIDYTRANRQMMQNMASDTCLTTRQAEGVLSASEKLEDDFDILDTLSREEIVAIINEMPTGYRLIVNLYLIDGYEHHEIAELCGISIGTSKSQLSRAKQFLQKKLAEIGLIRYEK